MRVVKCTAMRDCAVADDELTVAFTDDEKREMQSTRQRAFDHSKGLGGVDMERLIRDQDAIIRQILEADDAV